MTYTERFTRISEQNAYQRRIDAFGLTALLAPYVAQRPAQIPAQRTSQNYRTTAA